MRLFPKGIIITFFIFLAAPVFAQVQVNVPDMSGNVGEEVLIPINTAQLNESDQVVSFDARLQFDPSVLRPVEVVQAGTILPAGWSLLGNVDSNHPDIFKFGAFGATNYLTGSGPIAFIKFDVIGAPGSTSALNLIVFTFNGSDPPDESVQNGTFTVNYSTIQIQTNPSGRQFNFDGSSYTAPQTFKVSPNSSHSVDIPDPQMSGNNTRFVWSSWSDNGAKSHSITAPDVNHSINLVANFNKQYQLLTNISPANGGSVTKNPNADWFNEGTSVTITATPNEKYDFLNWNGTTNSSDNPLTLTMNQPEDITANFSPWPQMTIATEPQGLEIVVDGNTYTSPQIFQWQPGSNHSIGVSSPQESSGNTRYLYTNWSDGKAQTHEISVPNSDQTYTANFKTQYKLTLLANPDAGGTLSVNPSGNWYDANTQVQISATANANFQFVEWNGDLSGTQNPATITMDAPKEITGNFGETATVVLHTNPEGLKVWVDDSSQLHDAPYSFTALTTTHHTIGTISPQNETQASRLIWKSWDDGGSVSHEITISKSKTSYTATFGQQYKLSTSVLPSGAGTIATDPTGPWFDSGTHVQLTATAVGSFDFTEWTGDASGTSGSVQVTIDDAKNVTAHFKAWPRITIATNPSGLGITVDGNPLTAPRVFQWKPGSNHTIGVDSPQMDGSNKRYVFQTWSDGKAQEHSIQTPEDNATITANFKTQYKLSTSVIPAEGGNIEIDKAGPWYDENEVVTLTETPAAQYDFDHWSGDASGTASSVQIAMDGGKSIAANFKHWPEITVTTNPAGLEIIVDGTSATAPQIFVWQPGSSHTIEAVNEHVEGTTKKYVWVNWSDQGGRSHSIHAPVTNTTFTASYKTQYFVQTAALPSVGGSVTPTSNWFDAGTQVTFTAAPNQDFGFLNWSGSWSGNENPKTITVNGPIDVAANFSQYQEITIHTNPEGLKVKADGTEFTAPVTVRWLIGSTHSVDVISPQSGSENVRYLWESWSDGERKNHTIRVTARMNSLIAMFSRDYYVTVQVSPEGAGTISPESGWFAENSTITFTEKSNEGYEFLEWSGDASGNQASIQVKIDQPKKIIAQYKEWYTVTVRAQKTSATQTVLQIIVDGQTYDSPHTFHAQPNSIHTIEAPDPQTPEGQGRRYKFTGWSDRGERVHHVTISSNNMEFIAFYALQFHLTKSANPAGSGQIISSVSGDWAPAWKDIQLEAVPENGFIFSGWQGDLSGKQNPTTLYMNGPKSVQANFEVAKTAVTFHTNPPNQFVVIDGSTYHAPVTFNWDVGESHTVEAPETLAIGDSIRYLFNNWSNQGSRIQTIQVGTENQELTANFNTYYRVSGSTSKGVLTGFGWYQAGANAIVSVDSIVQVNEHERYLFSAWQGDISSKQASLNIKVNSPLQLRALFVHQFAIATQVQPENAGQIVLQPEQQWYAEGTQVAAEAIPNAGFMFDSWSGALTGSQNPGILRVQSAERLIAQFTRQVFNPVVSNFGINRYAIAQRDTIQLQFVLKDSSRHDSVSTEIIWFRNGVQDTLFNGKQEILPQNLHVGDVWYAEFRISDAGHFTRWHRTNACPVLPVSPVKQMLFQFAGNDTTIHIGSDSTGFNVHLTIPQGTGGQILETADTLEQSVNVALIAKSSHFYFNNTLNWYLLITGTLTNYSWSFNFHYTGWQLLQSGISQEDSLTIGWSEDLGNSWHYLNQTLVDTLHNVILAEGLNHFSMWAIGRKPFSQFYPVELSSFQANEVSEGMVRLTWETKTETNNLGFEIQRAKANGKFRRIGFVKGAGTSTNAHRYSFEDFPNKLGRFVYRLKQIDLNGTSHLSQTLSVEVHAPASGIVLRNYPNPFNNSTTIKFTIPEKFANQNASLVIYDVIGKKVKSYQMFRVSAGMHEINWNGKNDSGLTVPSGLFFYQLQIGNIRKMQKMILLK